MATLPLIRTTVPGIYQVCTTANTDYAIAIPTGAVGCIVWFETSASDSTIIKGRIGFDQANDAVTGITATSLNMGTHPPMPVEYDLKAGGALSSGSYIANVAYMHVANATAGAVLYGEWLFARDNS